MAAAVLQGNNPPQMDTDSKKQSSLEAGQLSKNKGEESRNRNDSGCVFDEEYGGTGHGYSSSSNSPWVHIVNQWSEMAHCIIEQERKKMLEWTEIRQQEMATAHDPKDKMMVEDVWREDVSSLMETAQDLLQCVANDVREMTSSYTDSSCGSSSLSSQDLGQILEEELFTSEKQDKIYVVTTRTEKKSKNKAEKNKRRRKRRSVKRGKAKEDINVNGKLFEQGSSFTIQVDELNLKKDVVWTEDETAIRTGGGGARWRKDEVSPMVWMDDKQGDVTPEDILSDWLRMRRRQDSAKPDKQEINDVFWNISLEQRQPRERRISQVLENLPFDDHPDIFFDRCELLEISQVEKRRMREKRMSKKTGAGGGRKGRPPMSYWNIFKEWKRNLDEERQVRKTDKRRRKGKQRRSRPPPKRQKTTGAGGVAGKMEDERIIRVFGKVRAGRRKRQQQQQKKKMEVEDYFHDAIGMFSDEIDGSRLRGRRRSRDDMEQEEEEEGRMQSHEEERRWPKRIKCNNSTWSEARGSFDLITESIEQKIREAFVMADYDENFGSDYEDEDDEESEELNEKRMEESREEFTELRDEVRRMRKSWHAIFRSADEAAAFADWRWNLDERRGGINDAEDWFEKWKDIFDDDQEEALEVEDLFQDWRQNMEEGGGEKKTPPRKKSFSKQQHNKSLLAKRSGIIIASFHNSPGLPRDPESPPAKGKTSLRRSNSSTSSAQRGAKQNRRLMVKCLARQPSMRGRNH